MSAVTNQEVLPAPAFRVAGDFVFFSSLLPLESGQLPAPQRLAPWLGESDATAQTRAVLAVLADVLAEAGSSMDSLLRLEILLSDAASFVDVKAVLAEQLDDPPAITTIVVGDEQLVGGALISIHGVALLAESDLVRESIAVDDVADPRSAEHSALAVKAGPFVFGAGLPATDFESGLAVSSVPGAYHESDAKLQAEFVLDRLDKVLAAAGTSIDQCLKVQFYQPDLRTFPVVDHAWGNRVGVAPTRSSMACRGLLVPGAVWVVNSWTLVPGLGLEKAETRKGIRWHPVDSGKASFSPGITAGDWLFTAGQIPVPDIADGAWVAAPPGLPHHWSDIEIQTNFTLDLLREQLQANGFNLADVVDAKVYLVDPRRDFRGFVRAWDRFFPADGPRPALSVIPSTQADGSAGVMIDGPLIEIDFASHRAASSLGGRDS